MPLLALGKRIDGAVGDRPARIGEAVQRLFGVLGTIDLEAMPLDLRASPLSLVDGTARQNYHKRGEERSIKAEVPVPAEIENIAPDIFRQRLLIEGYFARSVDEETVRDYLLGVAQHLGLRTYGEPVVFSPGAGTGRAENAGFDAFVPLIDSGISGYFWSGQKFLSILLYTCKGFDEQAALDYTRNYFEISGKTVTHAF